MNARHRRVGGEKVHTASLLQGSGLVRTVGQCAPRRVASGHRDETNKAKRRAFRGASGSVLGPIELSTRARAGH